MITDIKKILTELSYRVKDGSPDFENEQHLIKLYDVLKECQWPTDARIELIKTLTEAGSQYFYPQTKLPYIEGIGYDTAGIAKRTIEIVQGMAGGKNIIETLMNRAEFHEEQTQGMRDAHEVFKGYLTEVDSSGKKLTKQGVLDILKTDSGLEQQGSVKTKIYGDMDEKGFISILKKLFKGVTNIKSYAPRTGPNPSGRDMLFTWEFNGHEYGINLAKTSVTGRGAAQTKDQELSWLLFLSGMQYGADPKDKETFISTLISTSQVFGRVEGVNQSTALGLAAFLEQNEDWYNSHWAQCKKFISLVSDKQPTKYVKDGSSLLVNKLAKKLYQQDYGKSLDIDKWNPADVWLEYGSIPSFKTLSEYNNWLVESLKAGKGWIGVSLKKGGGKVGLVNDTIRKSYILSGIDTKYGGLLSQGVTFNYKGTNLDGLGLAFRIFSGKPNETVRGEGIAKGAEAVQGKVALPVLDDLKKGIFSAVSKVKGVSVEKDKKTKKWIFNPKGKSNFKTVKQSYSKIKGAIFDNNKHGSWSDAFKNESKFIERLNTHPKIQKLAENSVKANINSRFQTIVLGAMITNLSKTDLQKVMVGMLKYGKSESDWSSAHYKAQ